MKVCVIIYTETPMLEHCLVYHGYFVLVLESLYFSITVDVNISGIIRDLLFYLQCVCLCTHKNRLDEAMLMRTQNLCTHKNRLDEAILMRTNNIVSA